MIIDSKAAGGLTQEEMEMVIKDKPLWKGQQCQTAKQLLKNDKENNKNIKRFLIRVPKPLTSSQALCQIHCLYQPT